MTEPTDAEIFVVAREAGLLPDNSHPAPETRAARKHSNAVQAFARAVLAKWGTPPAVAGEPVQWQKRHPLRTDGAWENTNEHDAKWWRDNSQGWEIRGLYSTPQATQAQAGAVPLTRERLQEISLNYSDSEDECTGFRDGWRAAEKHYGIKGGQHGADN